MSTLKPVMKSKYDTQNQSIFSGYSRFAISTSRATEKSLNNFQNNKLTRYSVPEHTVLKKLHQFIGTVNVYLATKKLSSSFNAVFYSFNPSF